MTADASAAVTSSPATARRLLADSQSTALEALLQQALSGQLDITSDDDDSIDAEDKLAQLKAMQKKVPHQRKPDAEMPYQDLALQLLQSELQDSDSLFDTITSTTTSSSSSR